MHPYSVSFMHLRIKLFCSLHCAIGEALRLLFDEIFEEFILYPKEKEFYSNQNIFLQLKQAHARYCDVFGGIHLLRLIIALCVVSRSPTNSVNAPKQRGRPKRISTESRENTPADSSITFLSKESSVKALQSVLYDLENTIFPLACSA